MSKQLMFLPLLALAALMLVPVAGAQEANATATNLTVIPTGALEIETPYAADSRICIFIREWILKTVFVVILLVFLLGVAVMSGAAFPEWRDHGSKMILGAVGAVILYLLGLPALKFLMGVQTLCGM